MRNIFDQYSQPENRLTHSLVSAFGEDPKLLRHFVKWVTGTAAPKGIKIVEQQLPGEYELAEQEYEKRGLPDAWIHDDKEWSLLIESKVASPLSLDQLKRHYKTAQRRGFVDVTVLAIDVSAPKGTLPDYVKFRSWRQIYSWLVQQSGGSDWARRALKYLEVVERKWPADGYLREGTLTEFSGLRFDENNPYSWAEGKRLLNLIMLDLRGHKSLRGLINRHAPGRPAITGKGRAGVWDYLRIKGLGDEKRHTSQPHLTFGLASERIGVMLNMPNGMEGRYKKGIKALGEKGFFDLMSQVNENMTPVIRTAPGAYPFANILQRRFASVKSVATVDGALELDLRTAFDGDKNQKVKVQDQWLRALYTLILHKRSNLEWAVGIRFPYDSCKKTQRPEILDAFAESWVACKPLINVLKKQE